MSSSLRGRPAKVFFFFFNDTATTEIYTLSLHDALPIYLRHRAHAAVRERRELDVHLFALASRETREDRKSTRLNSSHLVISYAVFCLKKKKKTQPVNRPNYPNTYQSPS